ncbi:MAG: DegT/DnrJ/EryC1/StrS family aminotransferase [Candidatus Jorgensenbacteria bacterium]
MQKIPVSKPLVGEEEKKMVMEALDSGEISGNFGRFIGEFEEGFARYSGCAYGVATTSGTTALHLALVSLRIGTGDEVLVSTFTNMATFFAVLYTGATPVPIDIEPDTWNMNPAFLEGKVTPKTKAVLVVHVYGHPVDMDQVLAVARKHNLFVIEDAAEAHGAEYLSSEARAKGDRGKKVGSLGDIACFSFYANKIVTTGEGGMITTNDAALAARARSLRSLAYGKERKFMHEDVGFNYRLTNMQAALGCAQLKKIDRIIEMKRAIARSYDELLKDIPDLQLPVEKSYAKNVYWMYHVVLRGALEGKRKNVRDALGQRGIETREAFIPANKQEIFIKCGLMTEGDCPVANRVGENGFYLPSGPVLSQGELRYVADTLKDVLKNIQ